MAQADGVRRNVFQDDSCDHRFEQGEIYLHHQTYSGKNTEVKDYNFIAVIHPLRSRCAAKSCVWPSAVPCSGSHNKASWFSWLTLPMQGEGIDLYSDLSRARPAPSRPPQILDGALQQRRSHLSRVGLFGYHRRKTGQSANLIR